MFLRVAFKASLLFCFWLFTTTITAVAEEAPAKAASYEVLPGDLLEISVWDEPALQQEVLILPDSTMTFPLVGSINTDQMTLADIRQQLTSKLEEYIPNANVSVSARQLRGARVYVIGKVNRPGEILLDRELTVMQALSVAGGLNTFADEDEIHVLRRTKGVQRSLEINYSDLVAGTNLETNLELQAGDVVVVN